MTIESECARAIAEALESVHAVKSGLEGLHVGDGHLPPATYGMLGSACSCLGLAAERPRDIGEQFRRWGIDADD